LETYLWRRPLKRRIALLTVAVLLTAIGWADHYGWLLYAGHDLAQYSGREFSVAQVLDAQTLLLARSADEQLIQVRLKGLLERPQWPASQSIGPNKVITDRAVRFTRQSCEGRLVRLYLEPPDLRNRMGLLLAYVVFTGGTVLNEQLLAAGMARADQDNRHGFLERYVLLEQQARHDRIGFWAAEAKVWGRSNRAPVRPQAGMHHLESEPP
jgi:endonuclease YncB( thermonuclease family)